MTKRLDPDLKWLRAADKALRLTSERMREATLRFLWDKFVAHKRGLKKANGGT